MNRIGASVGLALRRYMEQGGSNTFTINGFDINAKTIDKARQMNIIDNGTRKVYETVTGCDLIVLAVSYEEVRSVYKNIAPDVRGGAVILDASPLKQPSMQWADEYLSDEQHVIGMTPIANPKYLFNSKNTIDEAAADYFDDSAILLTPSVTAIKEAVDLAFNFCQILGSKPRFLDPLEHDKLLMQTDGVPKLLGVALFYQLMTRDDWDDMQWFTNPAFGALTRPLFDLHPDALRDMLLNEHEVMARSLDEMITTLQQFRDMLRDNDRRAIEGILAETSEAYEEWVNHRYRADWDSESKQKSASTGGGVMRSLLGGTLTDRFFGGDDDNKR
jgi:prephenate dehydrogenase